jgi:lipoprotein-anchoring transpeptidase ErfK/SrfK
MSPARLLSALAVLLALPACQVERDGEDAAPPADPAPPASGAAYADPSGRFDDDPAPAVIERERNAGRWRSALNDSVRVDAAAAARAAAGNRERYEGIRPEAFRAQPVTLPLGGGGAGPSVVRAQVLLDRAGFSPGVIDGRWGDNVEKAVYFFQASERLPATGVVDRATFDRLTERAGRPQQPVVTRRLTEEDVRGPFVETPEDIYARAEMDRLVYESLEEQLGERFHATPDLLRRLNPGRPLDGLGAGDSLAVPNVGVAQGSGLTGGRRPQGQVARLVVSGSGGYLHALDAQGRVLLHFPVTLGARYDPTPQGDYRITNVARNPEWRYDPALLANVPDDEEPATIPPGPNNAVGLVWMALSEPHYGIHGTAAPETIGYTSSSGCVRLTNWDALTLADAVRAGVPVQFRDIAGREGDAAADSTGGAPRDSARSGPRPDSARRQNT